MLELALVRALNSGDRRREGEVRAQLAGVDREQGRLQEARQQREKILGQAREEAANKLEQVRREVALALENEKQLAATEAAAVAGEMVSKVLGRKVA